MTDGKLPGWAYEIKKNDPEEVKEASKALTDDPDEPFVALDILDDFDSERVTLLFQGPDDTVKLIEDDDEGGVVKIDFKKFIVQLPKKLAETCSVNPEIPAVQVRYTGYPWHSVEGGSRNDGRVLVLSIWLDESNDKSIRNLYFRAENPQHALMLVSALTRLIFDAADKSKLRTHRFYAINELAANVASTTTTERDDRDSIKLNKLAKETKEKEKAAKEATADGAGTSAETEASDEDLPTDLPDLKMSPRYLILDEESLCLFENPFSLSPLHDLRFYREESKRSIDTIFVCQGDGQLEVQNGETVYYIEPFPQNERATVSFSDLVDIFRRGQIKPKPLTTFSGTGKDFDSFYSVGFIGKPYKMPTASFGPPGSSKSDQQIPPFEPDFPASDFPPVTGDVAQSRGFGGKPASAASEEASWLKDLYTGNHLGKATEEFQLQWFEKEPEIETIISEGLIPEAEISSAGLNPDSTEQLSQVVDSIAEKMRTFKYGEAVSQLRACKQVYGDTLLSKVKNEREIDLLKRIYFLSG